MYRSISALFWGVIAAVGALATGTWDRAKRSDADRRTDDRNRGAHALSRSTTLTVKLSHDVYAALRCYVEAASGELTLLGTAQPDTQSNEIRVSRLLLPEQRSSSAHTEVSEKALAKLLCEAVEQGIDTSQLRVWLHSHGQMEAFFSATDQNAMDTAFPQADWVLSIVTNRAGQLKARLSLYKPFRLDVDDLVVTVTLPPDLEEAIRQEVASKVQQGYDYYGERSYGTGRYQARDNGGDGRGHASAGYALYDATSDNKRYASHVGND